MIEIIRKNIELFPEKCKEITSRIVVGTPAPTAAVASIHALAIAEILCVALGIAAVAFLPKRKVMKES